MRGDRAPAGHPRIAAIGAAARALVKKRDRWLNPPMDDRPPTTDDRPPHDTRSSAVSRRSSSDRTLTNLYNQRPTWLDLAHKKLDRAVLDAYGWPHDIADEAILVRLLALNLERAAGQPSTPFDPSTRSGEPSLRGTAQAARAGWPKRSLWT